VIDRSCDWHTHSNLTDGQASPEQMADAAAASGLSSWGLSDHVRADSSWAEAYVRMVRHMRRDGLRILCGVETKILDAAGALDFPPLLLELDYVLIADHQYPGAGGPISPRAMTQLLADGALAPLDAIDGLVAASAAAVAAAPYRPILAHLFSILPKMGLTEDAVSEQHLSVLAAALRAADGAVEANEKWRCPSVRVLGGLASRGVPLVAGSDAHQVDHVGVWDYVTDVAQALVAA
jgi:putative hydrolase